MWLLPVDLAPYQIALPPGRYSLPWFYSDQQIERILQLLRGLLRGVSHHVELRWDPARGWPVERLGRADTAMVMLRGAAPTDPCTVALLGRYVFVQPERPDDAGVGWCERFIKTRLVSIVRRVIADPNHPLAEMQLAKLPVDDAAAMTSDPVEFIELLEATIEHRFRYARFGLHDYDYRRSLRVVAGERLAAKLLTLPEEEQTPALELLLCGEPEDGDVSLAASALQRVGLAVTVGPDVMLLPLARAAREFVVWGTLGVSVPAERWTERVREATHLLNRWSFVSRDGFSDEERMLHARMSRLLVTRLVFAEPLGWSAVLDELEAYARACSLKPSGWAAYRGVFEVLVSTSLLVRKSTGDIVYPMVRELESNNGNAREQAWNRMLCKVLLVLVESRVSELDGEALERVAADAEASIAILESTTGCAVPPGLLVNVRIEAARCMLAKFGCEDEAAKKLDLAEAVLEGCGAGHRVIGLSRLVLNIPSDMQAAEKHLRAIREKKDVSEFDFVLSVIDLLLDYNKNGDRNSALKKYQEICASARSDSSENTDSVARRDVLGVLAGIVGESSGTFSTMARHKGFLGSFVASVCFRNGEEVSAERVAAKQPNSDGLSWTTLALARLRLGRVDEGCAILEHYPEGTPYIERALSALDNTSTPAKG